jgi:hypothetical protein
LLPRTGLGWVRLVAASVGALVIVVAGLFGIRLISESDCDEFTTDRATIAHEGLKISVLPADLVGSFGVKLSSVPLADFRANGPGPDIQAAAAALPADLTPLSSFRVIQRCSVDPRRATLQLAIPPEVGSTAGLDLYGWDAQSRSWAWLGGQLDAAAREVNARVQRVPAALLLVRSAPIRPTLGVEAPPVTGDAAAVLQAIPESATEVDSAGLYLGDLGTIVGDSGRLLGLSEANGTKMRIQPVIRNWGERGEVNRTLLRDLLADARLREAHIANLVEFVEAGHYGGIEVDYRGVDPAQRATFAEFIEALGSRLSERDRFLTVAIPAPSRSSVDPADPFDVPGYDLWRIGRSAVRVKLDLTTNPTVLGTDDLGPMIDWTTGLIDRRKVQVVLPTLGVQQDANGRVSLVGLEEALTGLGPLQADPPATRPGSTVRLKWSPGVNAPASNSDAASRAYSYSYVDNRGIQQTVWLGTAAKLKRVLGYLSGHNIRGITLRGALQPGNDEGIDEVIDGFARGDVASVPVPEPQVKVAFGQGTPFTCGWIRTRWKCRRREARGYTPCRPRSRAPGQSTSAVHWSRYRRTRLSLPEGRTPSRRLPWSPTPARPKPPSPPCRLHCRASMPRRLSWVATRTTCFMPHR